MSSSKVVIITGSASGIGKQSAKRFLEHGLKVCISDINEDLGKATTEELQNDFGHNNAVFVKCDVTKKEDWRVLWQKATDNLGYVDVLVNNAGLEKSFGWDKCLKVNLEGTSFGIQEAMNHMARSKGGSGGTIINISSLNGCFVPKNLNFSEYGYVVAKHAMNTMTKSLAKMAGHEGVTCFSFCPTPVNTNFRDFKNDARMHLGLKKRGFRLLTPEEVSEQVLKVFKMNKSGAVWMMTSDQPLVDGGDIELNYLLFYFNALMFGKLWVKLGFKEVPLTSMQLLIVLFVLLHLVLLTLWWGAFCLWQLL